MTQKMVAETQEYLADMSSSCQQKANDWAVRCSALAGRDDLCV